MLGVGGYVCIMCVYIVGDNGGITVWCGTVNVPPYKTFLYSKTNMDVIIVDKIPKVLITHHLIWERSLPVNLCNIFI